MLMPPLGGHLGNRASALLDGQLPEEEAERAWNHVEGCRLCAEHVERERWVKSRLAGLSMDCANSAPDALKGSLLGAATMMASVSASVAVAEVYLAYAERREHRARRNVGLAALGGSAVGAAVMGVIAFGAAPASAPTTVPQLTVSTVAASTPPTIGRPPVITALNLRPR